MRIQRAELPARLNGFDAAHKFFAACFGQESKSREQLWVAHVDEQARCIHLESYEGDETSSRLPIASIIRDAARHESAGLIVAHNHPSGDARPSQADLKATQALARADETIDLVLLDHLILAGGSCESLRRMGYL